MYNVMKKLVNRCFYAEAAEAQDKLDVFFAVGRLSGEQYAELTALVTEKYADA